MKNSIIIFVLITIMTSCRQADAPAEKPDAAAPVKMKSSLQLTEEQLRNAGVQTGKITTGDMSSTLQLKGVTALPPQGIVSIHVPLGGYLKSTSLRQGMYVRKGDLLAVLEDAQYVQLQQDYLNNLNQLKLADAEYNRQKLLFDTRSASEKVLQQAELAYNNLRIAVKSLEERLRLAGIDPASLKAENISGKIRISSPVNGYVVKVNANTGRYVQPTEELFELADLSAMYLVLDAFESDLPFIQQGTLLTAYTNQQPDKQFSARITLMEKSISGDRSVKVYADFIDPVNRIIPGTYMNATLEVSSTGSKLLPEEALVSIDKKLYVFVKESVGSFRLLEVQAGQSANGMTSIISDQVLDSMEIVLKGAYWLQMQLENQNTGEE